jgi:hypothetical protein
MALLAFREKILATAIDHVKLSKVTPAPDPSAAAIASHRELTVAVGDRGPVCL